ncbi:MAG: amidohydrolase/deacetylase family metallohydrolase [Bosea sp.]|uniref:amidohydrolase/deacetylase family metallohydrolase n=1 Tax=Bosea sp. (in: a-proteobacteria) TaxID=1871050 RepID=UPI001AD578C5|nr:amidohydrolase/deacetylase family metallohydrolase [Bosea sp. (in: a-proteobacteria)]MBN9450324.1 amidohydrolase/deacetylase family metallohydrolase [Bosea sp. (in: a-proteobacteria)]
MYDILIRGGQVIDPSQGIARPLDVAIGNGRIAALLEPGAGAGGAITIDARGSLVTPGLIDLHVHVYTHVPLGLDADQLCLGGGVTTMLDTGSAGSNNFDAFRRDCIDRAQCRVLALVNLSRAGLVAAELGELMDRRYADPEGVVRTIARHPGVAVGVKIRAGAHIIGKGADGWANLRDAIAAARASNTWLMVHIGECPMSIPEIVAELAPGDVLTHCLKGGSTRITDDRNRIFEGVRAASERGVVFDVGHGQGSFNWEIADAALADGLEPTTISTDVHRDNLHGPVFDMPTTMSKFLMLGVPIERVVEMSTTRPARVLGLEGEIGTLRVGARADVSVLEQLEGRFIFTDSYGKQRTGERLLVAAATVLGGRLLPAGGGRRMRYFAE